MVQKDCGRSTCYADDVIGSEGRRAPVTRTTASLHASSSGENRLEACLCQDPFNLLPFVALYFDSTVFDCSSNSAGLLHLFREGLFLWHADSSEVLNYGNRLASATCSLTDNIDTATIGIFLSSPG